ncbi:TetR/AcrR family transcriptional regulator [Furfurilactobacillus siliginis]|uniref:HTH tetR-type domain-containing protein n=1 Tax=Furfurilactobacillus siliginis TaxID=348151 RepID=A0A0R2LGQ7_9LACO|nr:TetR/AcrR family transcriptional regulator [Furfurilactobacillus siliginis]KRN97220.1 hypothetical protein IV55_GL000145 [Furfurilactobacillus siliginis]GEK29128.1 hypothetical protein LSI01_14390 [Furfurilactobacillus siliginis]
MVQKRDLSAEKIIRTTMTLISEQGPDAATFSNIATALSCKTQALYFYFKNRNDLLTAVSHEFFREINNTVQESCVGLHGREAVIALATAMRDFGLASVPLAVTVMRVSGISNDQLAASETKHLSQMLQTFIADFIDDDDPVKRLSLSRGVRALVVGEIVSESVGWFRNPVIHHDDSFLDNLNRLLAD